MKKNIIYLGIVALLSCCLWGCDEEKTLQYVNNPAINFAGGTGIFSFIATPDLADTVLTVDLNIMGLAADVDRQVNVEVLKDSTTAIDYEVLTPTIIEKGKYTGQVKVRVKNTPLLEEKEVRLWLVLKESDDFIVGVSGMNYAVLKWSNRLIQPANWRWLRYYFGTYSTRFYEFIIEVTGRTEFPYNHPDTSLEPMGVDEVRAWAGMVREALDEYNATHDDVMRHDDGDAKGEPIVIP